MEMNANWTTLWGYSMIALSVIRAVAPLAVGGYVAWLLIRYLKMKLRQGAREQASPAAEQSSDGLTLAERLRGLRAGRGFSQELLAERLGVSRQAVSKWETGAAEPSTANLLALADLYEITVDELLRGRKG